jgi:uncharacterized protein YcnI
MLAIAVAIALTAPAAAHVTTSVREAPAGGFTKFELRVPHGCEGTSPEADTVRVEVQIPEQIHTVTPQVVPGWDITVERVELGEPLTDGHGGEITERVATVSWEGGPLATDQLEEFGLMVRMPDLPGETMYFPTVQTCQSGEELAWIQIPTTEHEDLDYPAPAIRLLEATEQHGAPTEHEVVPDYTATGPEAADAAAPAADGGTDAVAVIALVLAGVALLVGGAALAIARARS